MENKPSYPRDRMSGPLFWAVLIHVLLLALLFASFSSRPELPPSRPIVKATLYQLESQNMATTQTQHKIAGEAEQTRTRDYAQEQLEQQKREQEQEAAARRQADEARKVAAQKADQERQLAAQKAAEEQKRQAEQQRQAEQKAAEKKVAEQKKLEAQRAEAARLKAAEEAKVKAEAERKKAVEEARKKAEAERKRLDEQKKKAAEEARQKAEAEKKKREAEQAAKLAAEKEREAQRRAEEERTAAALAELLGDGPVQRQSSVADRQGEQQAARLDDLIVQLVSQNWSRPDAARNGMQVVLDVEFLPDGTISRVAISRSSGNPAFDNSALAAVRNVARVREIQNLDRPTYERFYRKRSMAFRPEDLSQ